MYIAAETLNYTNIAKKQYLKNTLENELICLQKKGISLFLQGKPSSARKIASACALSKKDSSYMRDYILDETGNIRSIDFRRIKEK